MTAPIIELKMMYTITLPQTALKQVHLLYITVDIFLITWSFFVHLRWLIDCQTCGILQITSDGVCLLMWLTVYNMFVCYCSFWDEMNAIFFVGA